MGGVPESIFHTSVPHGTFTIRSLPAYLIEFLKYPCVITDRAFRREFGWEPTIDIRTTLASVRTADGATT